jgi:RND family efflux transporter MFP subunit
MSLLVALLAATAASAQDAETLTPSGTPAPIRAVKLIQPNGNASSIERAFFGQVVAKETLELSFEVGGRMIVFDAEEGQFLPKGTEIARLELGPLQREAERASLALQQAERDLARAQALANSNVASTAQRENAELQRNLADVALREAQAAVEDATLIAPFEALVASRLAPNFSNITEGQPIVRLHDMSEVRVEIDIPEQLFLQVSDAKTVSFFATSPLLSGEVPLTLREFNAETQNIGQSYRVTLALPPDQTPATVIPGASMTVIGRRTVEKGNTTILPSSALHATSDRGTRVMVYRADPGDETETETGTVHWVDVDMSSDTGSQIEVRGLEPDAQVVAAGAQMLQEGETVTPFVGLSVKE